MYWIKRLFSFYVFGNIHVALSAYCLTQISMVEFGIYNRPLAYFVFFSTVLAYNFIRLFQIDAISSSMTVWFRGSKRPLFILNLLSLGGALYFGLYFEVKELLAFIPFVLATILYVVPFKKPIAGLRFVPGLKLFLIAATWSGVTLLLPVYVAGNSDWESNILHFMQRLLFVIAITIPFDIRDAEFDQQELSTLPMLIGVRGAKSVSILALVLFLAFDLILRDSVDAFFQIDLVIAVVSALMVGFSGMTRSRFFTAFWVEAIPILWYILLLLIID